MEERKNEALKKVAHCDAIESQIPLTFIESKEKVVVLEAFKYGSLEKETLWMQKSRDIWLKEWDKITRYFHRMENSHEIRNHVKKFRINYVWASEDSVLKLNIVNAFESLMSALVEWRATPYSLLFSSINV